MAIRWLNPGHERFLRMEGPGQPDLRSHFLARSFLRRVSGCRFPLFARDTSLPQDLGNQACADDRAVRVGDTDPKPVLRHVGMFLSRERTVEPRLRRRLTISRGASGTSL